METLSGILYHIQRRLLPVLEEELGPLSDLDEQFCKVISLLNLSGLQEHYRWVGNGCPPHARVWLFHAFVAKAVYQFPTTGTLINALKNQPRLRRLCGWESLGAIPSESTFSRAFSAFSRDQWPQAIHEKMVERYAQRRLAVGHISRDSTAIAVPEKRVPKAKTPPPLPRERGRPRKGQKRQPEVPKRLDLQLTRTLWENLTELPRVCNVGCKRNSRGHQESWIGYKLHLDTIDGDIPISAILTSASVHDSQVAIPLAQMSAQRVTSLYDLMDGAYDAPQIRAFSRQLGHIPIIEGNPRKGVAIPFDPAQALRFKHRTSSERVNSSLKQRYGAKWVRVKGALKVMAHLMFGVIALTATALFERLL